MYFFSVPGVLVSFVRLLILRFLVLPDCFFHSVYLIILSLILLVITASFSDLLNTRVYHKQPLRVGVRFVYTLPSPVRPHLWDYTVYVVVVVVSADGMD